MHRTLDYTAPVPLNDQSLVKVLDYAQLMYDRVPLVSIELTQQLDDVTFNYEILAQDGRTWSQQLVFDAWPAVDVDPPMTFDVPSPGWRKDAEFVYHRPLRDHLISMVLAGLTSLEITWHV